MRIRALIVDDEPLARQRVRLLLGEETDMETVGECEDGVQAVGQITALKPDLLFLDVQMPEMDGYQVLRRIRSLPNGRTLPVVALTALTSELVREKCDAEGMDDFVSKPVTLARIGQLLGKWSGRRRVPGPVG